MAGGSGAGPGTGGPPGTRWGQASAGHGGAGREAAIGYLRRAARLHPETAEIHHDLGILLRQDDQIDAAIACQRRALSLQPGFLSAWMSLGNALLEMGNTAAAAQALERAASLSPGTPEIWFNLGNLHYRAADLDRALTCYRRSMRLGLAAARARVVATLCDQGQDAAAEAALAEYLPLAGTDVSTCLEHLYAILVRSGRSTQARTLFTQLETVSFAGKVYPVECRTALSALDLLQGDPRWRRRPGWRLCGRTIAGCSPSARWPPWNARAASRAGAGSGRTTPIPPKPAPDLHHAGQPGALCP